MAQAVNDEGHNQKDQYLAPRNVSAWYQDQETATSFHRRGCQGRFMSPEMAALHAQMEHQSMFASYYDAQFLIEFLIEPVRSPRSWCIYERTAALVANDMSDLLRRNERMDIVHSAYDSLLELEPLCGSASGRVALLTGAIPQRARLVELSSGLPCRRGPLWEALKIDYHSILAMLHLAVSCDQDEIMGLREDGAAFFLTLADSVLYPREYGHYLGLFNSQVPALEADSEDFRYHLRRTSVRLSMASYQLPESLYLSGVTLVNREQVAAGAYAEIRMGRYRERLVALKTMRVYSRQRPNELSKVRKAFCREISLLHGLDHDNICGLIGIDRELFGGQLCLVTEWMSHGSIEDFIESNSFDLAEAEQFVMGIALALEYLHSKNVVHGDLHVRNILIDADRHVRLADFGLSDFSDASSTSVSSAVAGATRFMAPEILDPEKYGLPHVRHTPKSDIHSFAMCVWTIFDCKAPFRDFPIPKALNAIIGGERPLQDTARHRVPTPLWSLLELCWQEQPRDRPSSSDLCLRLRCMLQPFTPVPLKASVPDMETQVMGRGFSGHRGVGFLASPLGELLEAPGSWCIHEQREREPGTLEVMGLAKLGQRQGIVDDPTDPGPTSSFVPRGAHERVEEDGRERERKRKGKGVQRFRQNSYAFEAPHLIPVPMVHQGANPLLSAESGVPSGPTRKLPMQSSMQRLTPQDGVSTFTDGDFIACTSASAEQQVSPTGQDGTDSPLPGLASASGSTNLSASFSPDPTPSSLSGSTAPSQPFSLHPGFPGSEDLSLGANSLLPNPSASNVSSVLRLDEEELARSSGALAVSTESQQQGTISTQLPSPSSGTIPSSSTGRDSGDQHPPINILYVGNLPAITSPGASSAKLEERLRELFQKQSGYRRLYLRHKMNGYMCLVEFDGVAYAMKALNDLNGDNLRGLIKGRGIQLSYADDALIIALRRAATIPRKGAGRPGSLNSIPNFFANPSALSEERNSLLVEAIVDNDKVNTDGIMAGPSIRKNTWLLTHSHYAAMYRFVFDPSSTPVFGTEHAPDLIPDIPKDDIKSGGLAKAPRVLSYVARPTASTERFFA